MRVLVPLGKRKVIGVLAGFLHATSLKDVREILAPLDDLPILDDALLRLCHWTSQYYLSPIGEVLANFLPPGLRRESQKIVYLLHAGPPVAGALEKKILEAIRANKGKTNLRSLGQKVGRGGLHRALNRLVHAGAVEVREERAPRHKKIEESAGSDVGLHPHALKLSLTSEQEEAVHAIRERVKKGGFETFFLYGVTGSGKTEIYLRAMEEARNARRRCLILVPEISLTPQLLDRLQERFPGKVGILHSALRPTERWAQWWHVLRGHVDVVVGARSAIFAPLPDLGLIIVDEEHDRSYKQEEGLRYHARDLAVVRGKLAGCSVLLGTATPAVESFENCRQGRYRILELTERVEQKPLPQVEVVDLRSEPTLFSPRLKEALLENHSRGKQSLIFLNRRGFANFLQCHLCGFVLRCAHCSVTLTYHRKHRSLFCHHCGFRRPAVDLCPGCSNPGLAGVGSGTEKVEKELALLVPQARIARMDRDTTSRRGSQERLIRQWHRGEIDILVGTQMVTKGHDVLGVTLVGVILADLSLNLPDFRAAERTFQLLAQVAGRAGRGKEPGRVIIQTYLPEHYVLRHVLRHDYKGFFASEIGFRKALSYPPFSRLILLRLEGLKRDEVEARARLLGEALRKEASVLARHQIEILGPAPAPIERLRSRHRWQILLKGERTRSLLELAKRSQEVLPRSRNSRLYIDVDPYDML